MRKTLRVGIIFAISAAMLMLGGLPGSADPTLEETKQLLQKSLTLYEIDQEIARLTTQEERIGLEILVTEEGIAEKQEQVAVTREHAGKVLRAYYMGERDNIWMLLFSAKSFSEAISVYDYLSTILENDKISLNAYADSYQDLQDTRRRLVDTQTELVEVKAQFIAQREKVAAIQREIDEQLARSQEAEALLAEMERFTKEWQEQGIPLFRKYLASLAEAMQSLPELLTGENGTKFIKNASFTQKSMEFEIGDGDLNTFFRSKSPVFDNLTFRFEEGSFMATGTENQIEVSLAGRYTVENDPRNMLKFHVDELTYNGFILPETSNLALEQEFDMGFTPGKYIEGLIVTEVTLKDGKLNLKLKL